MSAAGPNDHEASGIYTNTGGGGPFPYNAFYAVETGYEFSQAPFPYPSGVVGLEQAFSPTIHGGWGGCLEDSTYYRNDDATDRSAHFTVFNFCLAAPTFIFDTQITSAFVSQYEGRLPNGEQGYVVESFTPDAVPNRTSTWYTIVYNFSAQRWDLFISANAQGFYSATAFGWDIAETYFAQGQCPQLAPSGSSVVAYFDSASNAWVLQQPTMPAGLTTQIVQGPGSSCFLPNGSQPATLQFQLESPNMNWIVTSPR